MASANKLCHLFRRIMFAAVILCIGSSLSAQSSATYTIKATALYDGSSVILRWAPTDFATWDWANFNGGYDVERTTLELNGLPLSGDSMLASKVLLASNLEPWPEMQWESLPDTNMAGIVAGSIYGDSIEVVDMANADFMTVINTNETRQNRLGFSLFACDQNFDIALAAGLAFLDTTAIAQAEYIYVVKLHNLPSGATQKKGLVAIKTNAGSLPTPPKPFAKGADKLVMLTWEKQAEYSSFLVERSSDNGLSYQDLNDKPFVSLSAETSEKQIGTFMDSLPDNNASYVYRVRGLTAFGIFGPPSDTVHAGGIPAPLGEPPFITQVTEPVSGQMQLNWSFPTSMESLITQFEVHRSATIDGAYSMISTAVPSERSATDNTPLSVNYYVVKAKDINGHYATSLPKMGQSNDEQPPAAPTGLSGACDDFGQVTISWLPNGEEDLKGYRVYMSDQDQVDSAFVQLTEKPVRDTFFRFEVSLNSLTEQMFFNVKAVDLRENTSVSSAYLNLQRPDVVAPSAPAITKVIPRSEAVQLDVSLSSSRDVLRYEFQKRWEGSPDWELLESFLASNMVTSYTDSLSYLDPVMRRRWYYYRLVAFDGADLSTSSQMIRTKPLDQGMRGAIQNLTAVLVPGPPKEALLQWTYPLDMDLAGFQIYRGIDDSQMRSFKFVPTTYFPTTSGTYVYRDSDTNLKNTPQKWVFTPPPSTPGGATASIVPAVINKPNSVAPASFIKLKYQVVAVFYDGAQSPLSPLVEVLFQ